MARFVHISLFFNSWEFAPSCWSCRTNQAPEPIRSLIRSITRSTTRNKLLTSERLINADNIKKCIIVYSSDSDHVSLLDLHQSVFHKTSRRIHHHWTDGCGQYQQHMHKCSQLWIRSSGLGMARPRTAFLPQLVNSICFFQEHVSKSFSTFLTLVSVATLSYITIHRVAMLMIMHNVGFWHLLLHLPKSKVVFGRNAFQKVFWLLSPCSSWLAHTISCLWCSHDEHCFQLPTQPLANTSKGSSGIHFTLSSLKIITSYRLWPI